MSHDRPSRRIQLPLDSLARGDEEAGQGKGCPGSAAPTPPPTPAPGSARGTFRSLIRLRSGDWRNAGGGDRRKKQFLSRRLWLCQHQAYFAERGTQVLVQDPECNHDQPSPPSALLLGPACHKKSTTLVCLAQGFSYKWPLEVSWKRDGQEVPRLSVATEKAKRQDKCSFGIASRLSVAAEEWKQGYNYLCHVSQGHITAEAEITSKRSLQTDLGFSHIGYSLRIGQLIFLLLTVKSFAYGTVLGIYTLCRKTNL